MDRVVPGSIPDAPTFAPAKGNTLPGITCPDPALYLDKSGASKGDIAPQRAPRKRRAAPRRPQGPGRISEDRSRADRLQAALILARRRTIDPFGEDSPFDVGPQQLPFAPNNDLFLEEVDNARIRESR